jgi:hypothetical protein
VKVRLLIAATVVGAAVITPVATANAEPYYKNCAAARQAGVAPLTRDDPGYAPHLDRDDDGIACE